MAHGLISGSLGSLVSSSSKFMFLLNLAFISEDIDLR